MSADCRILKLTDVPIQREQLMKLDVKGDRATWIENMREVYTEFTCHVEELVQFAIDKYYPGKGQKWRRKQAGRIVSIYYDYEHQLERRPKTKRKEPKEPTIPDSVRRVVARLLEWIRGTNSDSLAAA